MIVHSQKRRVRPAFSLVELLVVITILMLLTSIVLFGLAGVQNTANDRRARAQVMRIHQLISEKMATFENRRVRLQPHSLEPTAAKLASIRELMRLEMPDRITDIIANPSNPNVEANRQIVAREPALATAYRRIVANQAGSGWTYQHQGAECLYMILARTYIGDSNGLQFFTEQEIGDVDGDRMLEILDPWGNPIEFLRWAPGVTSPPQGYEGYAYVSTIQGNNPADAWDPFDPMQADTLSVARNENNTVLGLDGPPQPARQGGFYSNFAMFPLIVSAGRDGRYNLALNVSKNNFATAPSQIEPLYYNLTGSLGSETGLANDPYSTFKNTAADPGEPTLIRLGQVESLDRKARKGHLDNITNHFIESQ